jgi:hypothetical protein
MLAPGLARMALWRRPALLNTQHVHSHSNSAILRSQERKIARTDQLQLPM